MKEKLTKNAPLKLISLLCAFLVWLAVVNVANPIQTKSVEVPVNIINAEVLESSNLTYEIEGKSTVTILVNARARDIYRFTSEDFKAYADLSELYSVTGAVPVTVEVLDDEQYLASNGEGVKYEVKAPGTVHIKTEELQTKRFSLTHHVTGTPAGDEDYLPGKVKLTPNYVYVRGPVSQIGQISSVGVEINIDGKDSDLSGTVAPKFYDANDNELTLSSSVTILGGDISYELTMLKVKNLALDFQVSGQVADGYRLTGVECGVSSVSVAGLRSVLANMNTLPIESPELSAEGLTADKECTIDLAEFVPPGLELAGMDNTVVTVTLKVEPLENRTYTIDGNDITLKGASDEYVYELADGTAHLTVSGLKEDLNSLSPDKMTLSADVSGMKPGTHTAVLSYQLDDAYAIVGTPSITLEVKEKTPETEAAKEDEEVKASSESIEAVPDSSQERTEPSGAAIDSPRQ